MTELEWNPRFAAYAKAQGRTPDDQLAHDKAELPGACMFPFVEWNRARLKEFFAINRSAFICGALTDHAAYDAWLAARIAA